MYVHPILVCDRYVFPNSLNVSFSTLSNVGVFNVTSFIQNNSDSDKMQGRILER